MKWILYVGALVIHILGLILFLSGFFPSKVVLSGYNGFHASSQTPFRTSNGSPQQFDKFVLMVVDAMRADFLYSDTHSGMSFVHQLISEGVAIPYTAFSNPPTVTLPRLKGITTGGTPSFLDAILNVADDKDDSQGLSSQDSWVRQFRYKDGGKKINFYGDDTWLKLFSKEEFFDETDGTNSFFVSDFTEVDNNVTRHLDTQLATLPSKWDGLILHYLGLDHIGHKGGPNSIFMADKHKEMDSIIERIYKYITSKKQADNTLFIIMGDHGMNEVGNHGGSSEGETNAGLLLVSPKFKKFQKSLGLKAPAPNTADYSYFNKINQIDLVPTLATLLNFPIPKNNLGVITRENLLLWDRVDERKRILLENCYQFKQLVDAKFDIDLNDADLLDKFNKDEDIIQIKTKWDILSDFDRSDIENFYDFLYKTQEILASSATNYDYLNIQRGYTLLVLSAVIIISVFLWYFLTASVSLIFPIGFLAFSISYASHFFGSSFIEEEHQIWWFFVIVSIFSIFAYTKCNLLNLFIILICTRVIRSFANTGQKFKTPSTFSSILVDNPDILWILNAITYLVLALSIYGQGKFVHCFGFSMYTTFKDRNVNDFGPLLTFIGVFVTVSLSFLFKTVQFYNDGMLIPSWLNWLVEWNCESFGVVDLATTDKKQLQNVLIQLSRLFAYSLGGLFALRLVIGRIRGIREATITDLSNIITAFLIHQTRTELIPIFIAFFIIRFTVARIIQKFRAQNIDQLIVILVTFTLCLQNISFFLWEIRTC